MACDSALSAGCHITVTDVYGKILYERILDKCVCREPFLQALFLALTASYELPRRVLAETHSKIIWHEANNASLTGTLVMSALTREQRERLDMFYHLEDSPNCYICYNSCLDADDYSSTTVDAREENCVRCFPCCLCRFCKVILRDHAICMTCLEDAEVNDLKYSQKKRRSLLLGAVESED